MDQEPQRRVTPVQPIRVAVIPFSDPYVDAVLPDDVVRVGPSGEPSPWLESWHVAAHASDVDVVHLHTGFDHLGPAELEDWTGTIRRLDVPLVVTVHDLPPDAECLGAVLSTAEVVLALTPGAADEIGDRFGRTAIVVACPSLAVADPEIGAERGLVGLRMPPGAADASALVRAAHSGAVSGGGRLRLLVEPGDELADDVRELVVSGDVELVHCARRDRVAHLQQLHVAVLPERPGSHSRDLEICRDVGTRVVAPRAGRFTEQWSEVVPYGTDDDGLSLSAAVAAALTPAMPRPADRAWRREQAAAVARVHRDVYAQVAADRSWV
jgi:hypothetical protein